MVRLIICDWLGDFTAYEKYKIKMKDDILQSRTTLYRNGPSLLVSR